MLKQRTVQPSPDNLLVLVRCGDELMRVSGKAPPASLWPTLLAGARHTCHWTKIQNMVGPPSPSLMLGERQQGPAATGKNQHDEVAKSRTRAGVGNHCQPVTFEVGEGRWKSLGRFRTTQLYVCLQHSFVKFTGRALPDAPDTGFTLSTLVKPQTNLSYRPFTRLRAMRAMPTSVSGLDSLCNGLT